MDKAIDIAASHLAKKAAKAKGTTSDLYIQGYKDALVWSAKLPEGLEMLTAMMAEAEAEAMMASPSN